MIRRARKKRNLTQKQLAKMCGLTQGHISKLENFEHGDSLPTLRHIIIIARELNLNPYKLASWFIFKDQNKFEFSNELCLKNIEFDNSNLSKF
nr:helix-turn-helix domain-containing protein [Paeniclostridium ghonii]